MRCIILLSNRLKVLLAERNLKIKDVVKNTSLSRNTISNLVNNPTSNVSTKTLDELCYYLKINPQDFFTYIPCLIEFKEENDEYYLHISHEDDTFTGKIIMQKVPFNELDEKEKKSLLDDFKKEEFVSKQAIFYLKVEGQPDDLFFKLLTELPLVFQKEIQNGIGDFVQFYLDKALENGILANSKLLIVVIKGGPVIYGNIAR